MPKRNKTAQSKNHKDQVAALKQQLDACQRALAATQANHEQELQFAAELGYETAWLEAEERETQRAIVIAEAAARFEQQLAKQMARSSVLERASQHGVRKKQRPVKAVAKARKPAAARKSAVVAVRQSQKPRPTKPAYQPESMARETDFASNTIHTNESVQDTL